MQFRIRNQNNRSIENKTLKFVKGAWQIYEKRITNEIKKLTGLSLNTRYITCYIDSSTPNGFYGHTTITLGTKGGITKQDALMVITHELFHIFYWRKIKRLGLTPNNIGTETKDEWKLAEIAAFLITNEPSLKKYWKSSKVYLYPETKGIYKKVKGFWKKGNLDYFLVNSYLQLKK